MFRVKNKLRSRSLLRALMVLDWGLMGKAMSGEVSVTPFIA